MADLISELAGKSDDELAKVVGFDQKLKSIRENLEKANGLSGEARKKVVKALERGMAPSTFVFEDLDWQIKDAERQEKTGASPSEIVNCCCGD